MCDTTDIITTYWMCHIVASHKNWKTKEIGKKIVYSFIETEFCIFNNLIITVNLNIVNYCMYFYIKIFGLPIDDLFFVAIPISIDLFSQTRCLIPQKRFLLLSAAKINLSNFQ